MITINGYPGQTLAHTLEHLLYCLSDINTKYHSHSGTHLQLGGVRKNSEIYARYEGSQDLIGYLLSFAKLSFKDELHQVKSLSSVGKKMLKRYKLKHVAEAFAQHFEDQTVSVDKILEEIRNHTAET
jgi:hypothetical protein